MPCFLQSSRILIISSTFHDVNAGHHHPQVSRIPLMLSEYNQPSHQSPLWQSCRSIQPPQYLPDLVKAASSAKHPQHYNFHSPPSMMTLPPILLSTACTYPLSSTPILGRGERSPAVGAMWHSLPRVPHLTDLTTVHHLLLGCTALYDEVCDNNDKDFGTCFASLYCDGQDMLKQGCWYSGVSLSQLWRLRHDG